MGKANVGSDNLKSQPALKYCSNLQETYGPSFFNGATYKWPG